MGGNAASGHLETVGFVTPILERFRDYVQKFPRNKIAFSHKAHGGCAAGHHCVYGQNVTLIISRGELPGMAMAQPSCIFAKT